MRKSGFTVAPFDLNYRRGQLRLKSVLDYDAIDQQRIFVYRLSAFLEGINLTSASMRLVIALTDDNDNCPRFASESLPSDYIVQLASDMPSPDTVIFRPIVTDADADRNAQIVFKLIGVNGSDEYFRINPFSGKVQISSELPIHEDGWFVRVLAMDIGAPISQFTQLTTRIQFAKTKSTKNVTTELGVTDSCTIPNQFAPVFRTKPHETLLVIHEDAEIGTVCAPVLISSTS